MFSCSNKGNTNLFLGYYHIWTGHQSKSVWNVVIISRWGMGSSNLEVPVQTSMSHTNNSARSLQMFVLIIQLNHYKNYWGAKSTYHLKSCSHYLHGSISGIQEVFQSHKNLDLLYDALHSPLGIKVGPFFYFHSTRQGGFT